MNQVIHYLGKIFPLIRTLQNYSRKSLQGDLSAGITVGIMLIPQGMAYAILAGMPPVYGLYAAIVPLFIYALFGTSRQLAVGPVAMVSLLVIAGVGEFAEPGSSRFISLALLTALGVGLFQLLMGIFRMGFLVNFLSHPVLSGFTSAAALIIGASQIPNITGINARGSGQVHAIVIDTLQQIGQADFYTVLVGIGSVIGIILIRKWSRKIPSALVVVVVGILVTYLFSLHQLGLSIIGDIPKGLPAFGAEFISIADFRLLFPVILVISLVSYMESIAVAKAIAKKEGYRLDPNQELVALGGANIGGAFFQSFPTTGGFSRTAVNAQAGAASTVASIVSAAIVGLTVLFLTPLFYYLPTAVLAAIIMVAVAGLFNFKEMVYLWKTDRKDFSMLAATFLATLIFGIEEGIGIGVLLSLVLVIYSSTLPHSAELGRLGNTDKFRNVERYKNAIIEPEMLIFRFDASLYFANSDHFVTRISTLIEKRNTAPLSAFILDASAMNYIDSTGIHALERAHELLEEKGIKLVIAAAIGPVRDKLKRTGMTKKIGEENFFFDIDDAVQYFRKKTATQKQREFSPLQTNL
jgi:SulP family sulfate permease